ncbi:MAG: hypothetical protein EBU01_02625 [Crocinitomicaceae bacterium]|nr:hypothetical protein [Crocinitomicaceae bacterium]
MKEELLGPKVENVAIALVQMINEEKEKEYYVYLINLRDDIMEGIIVASTGYGENANTGEKVKTSTLRHCIEILLPNEAAKIEPIMPELFGLSNEYWLSFWVNDTLYDKRYVFPAESIVEENFVVIEQLGLPGVIIK